MAEKQRMYIYALFAVCKIPFVPRDNVAGAIDALSTEYQISYRDDSFFDDSNAVVIVFRVVRLVRRLILLARRMQNQRCTN